MKLVLGILGLLISLQLYGQREPIFGESDQLIDTTSINQNQFISFYRIVSAKPYDLDFDNFTDTIVWRRMMIQSIKGKEAYYEEEDQLQITNKHGTLTIEGDWSFMDKKLIVNSGQEDNLWISVSLDSRTSGLILAHQKYASEIDAYTLIKVDSLAIPEVIFDSEFILTSLLDLDNDGFAELIGKHPNYGIPEYRMSYVPYMVLKYFDSLILDNNLTLNYNLPDKNYREFPESSITLLTQESLKGVPKEKLRIMRNEVFADYGYVFNSKDLQEYFSNKGWYTPRPNHAFILTDWEKKNIELIKKMENK